MNFLLEKIKSRAEKLTDKQIYDINRLYEDHKNKKTNVHSSVKILVKQIELGLDDLYERHYLIKKCVKPKDSSSLHSFVIRYGEKHGNRMFDEKNKKTVNTLEKYIEKYGGTDGPKKYREYCVSKGNSLDGFVIRHGELDGPEKHKEYWKNTFFSMKKERFLERYGEAKGEEEYKKAGSKISFSNTLEGYQDRYGAEEGEKRYKQSNEQRRRSQSKEVMVNKMLDDGKSIDEILIAVEDRWSNSLKTYQRKYGDEEGKKRYDELNVKLRTSNPACLEYYEHRNIPEETAFEIISDIQAYRNSRNNFYSKESMVTLLPITTEIERITNSRLFCGENEFFIRLRKEESEISGKRMFFYDFTFPDLDIIIEYHGERYHEDIDYGQTSDMCLSDFKDYYTQDHFKKWVAESRGYDIFIVRSWHKKTDLINLRKFLIERGIDICEAKFI